MHGTEGGAWLEKGVLRTDDGQRGDEGELGRHGYEDVCCLGMKFLCTKVCMWRENRT